MTDAASKKKRKNRMSFVRDAPPISQP